MNKTFYDETTHQWITDPSTEKIPEEGEPESSSQPIKDPEEPKE